MTKKLKEKLLLKDIDELIENLGAPTKDNRIDDDRLRHIIAFLLAIEHVIYYDANGPDKDDDKDYIENMETVSTAFDVMSEMAAINLEVADDVQVEEE
jgi:hypothetical protein